MISDMEHKYPLGSFWAYYNGGKCVVIAHDFVSDDLVVYDCLTKQEKRITRNQFEDRGAFKYSWSEALAFEAGVIDALRPVLDQKLRDVFFTGKENIDGESRAMHRWVNTDGAEQLKAYGEYFLVERLAAVTSATLIAAISRMCATVEEDFTRQKVDRIVWRIHPEFDVGYGIVTGERMLKIYARFLAFSNGDPIKPQEFTGARKDHDLTKVSD